MYHVGRNGQQTGPFSIEQLKTMAANGELLPTDLVWKEGMAGWEPASTLPGVFQAAAVATTPAYPAASATQPAPVAQATVLPPAGVQVENYLVWAILSTICCCIPFGIPAIVFASQVNSKLALGDVTGAREASRKAKMWCWIAFGAGLLVGIIGTILQVVAGAAAAASGNVH
jgi:hypothetical protein